MVKMASRDIMMKRSEIFAATRYTKVSNFEHFEFCQCFGYGLSTLIMPQFIIKSYQMSSYPNLKI